MLKYEETRHATRLTKSKFTYKKKKDSPQQKKQLFYNSPYLSQISLIEDFVSFQ